MNNALLVIIGVSLVAAVIAGEILVFLAGRLWLQAHFAGLRLSMLDLIAMRLRRIDCAKVLECLILAKQSGVEISCHEMQRACLQGVDLEKLTLAYIEARKQRRRVSFEDLIDAELRGRLAKKLKA